MLVEVVCCLFDLHDSACSVCLMTEGWSLRKSVLAEEKADGVRSGVDTCSNCRALHHRFLWVSLIRWGVLLCQVSAQLQEEPSWLRGSSKGYVGDLATLKNGLHDCTLSLDFMAQFLSYCHDSLNCNSCCSGFGVPPKTALLCRFKIQLS